MSGRQTTSVLLYSQHSTPTGCVANKLFSMCRMFIVFGTLLKKNLVKRKKCFFFLLPARANGVWRMSNNKWKWGCKLKRSISSRDSRNDGFFLQLKRVPKSSVVPWWNKKKKWWSVWLRYVERMFLSSGSTGEADNGWFFCVKIDIHRKLGEFK